MPDVYDISDDDEELTVTKSMEQAEKEQLQRAIEMSLAESGPPTPAARPSTKQPVRSYGTAATPQKATTMNPAVNPRTTVGLGETASPSAAPTPRRIKGVPIEVDDDEIEVAMSAASKRKVKRAAETVSRKLSADEEDVEMSGMTPRKSAVSRNRLGGDGTESTATSESSTPRKGTTSRSPAEPIILKDEADMKVTTTAATSATRREAATPRKLASPSLQVDDDVEMTMTAESKRSINWLGGESDPTSRKQPASKSPVGISLDDDTDMTSTSTTNTRMNQSTGVAETASPTVPTLQKGPPSRLPNQSGTDTPVITVQNSELKMTTSKAAMTAEITAAPPTAKAEKRKAEVIDLGDSDDEAAAEIERSRKRVMPNPPPQTMNTLAAEGANNNQLLRDVAKEREARRQRAEQEKIQRDQQQIALKKEFNANQETKAGAGAPVGPNAFYGDRTRPQNDPKQAVSPLMEAKKSATPESVDLVGNTKADENIEVNRAMRDISSLPPEPVEISKPQPSVAPYKPYFPNGTVKKTYRMPGGGGERDPDDIKIEEVLLKGNLQKAILSAFNWDYEWIMNKLPLGKIQHLTLVMQGKDQTERQGVLSIFDALPKVTVVFPSMEGQVNCMHSKMMVLWLKPTKGKGEYLRVVVPTANLSDYDWGEGPPEIGTFMENSVFLIDLPLLPPNSNPADPEDPILPNQTFFHKELARFMTHKGIPEDTIIDMARFDFSATRPYGFVHSIGGSHTAKPTDDTWRYTGICGFATTIKQLNLKSPNGLEIDYITSSLGNLKLPFLADLYHAAQGHTGIRELIRRQKGATAKNLASSIHIPNDELSDHEEETDLAAIKSHFRAYFPSAKTVADSRSGPNGAGTICFQRKWWSDPNFPRECVKDCRSVRENLLMHNKILYARPPVPLKGPVEGDGKIGAWAYVGSANLSESAWGKLVVDRASKGPKLNCRNWECGVVVPVWLKSEGRMLSGEEKWPEMPVRDLGRAFKGGEGKVGVPVVMEMKEGSMEEPWFMGEFFRG